MFQNTGAKAIVMAPQDTGAIASTLDTLATKKIPVVSVDTRPDKGEVYMVVRADNRAYGTKACEYLGEQLGGKGKVAEFAGRPGLHQRTRPLRGLRRLHEGEVPEDPVLRTAHRLEG